MAPSSSGLGQEVFSLLTWVRVPMGSLRAHSSMVEQFPFKEAVEGSNPSGLTLFIGGSSNGRTAAFGAVYSGSNPGPPALASSVIMFS